jgi:hypothetical protein
MRGKSQGTQKAERGSYSDEGLPYSAESIQIQSIIDDPLGAGVSVNQRFLFVVEKLELETSSCRKKAIFTVDS